MRIKKTTEQFKREVQSKYENEYTVVGEYINSRTKIEFIHNKCNDKFGMTPENILQGKKCPYCNTLKISKNRLMTTNDFKSEVFNLVGDEYTVVDEYQGRHKPINFRHETCNTVFSITPNRFVNQGSRCTNKDCLHKRISFASKDDEITFIEKFNKISNGEYVLLSNYNLSCEKINIKHIVCGHEFEMTPNSFLSNQGCPKCRNIKISNKLSLNVNDFIQKIKKIHGENISLYGEYKNMHTCTDFICNNCNHIWSALPSNVIHKKNPTGCPICKVSKGEQRIYQYLKNKDIDNIQQMKFNDLVGVGNNPLSYDFYLPNDNLLIEFQGKQHYKPVEAYGGKEQFKVQQEHDKRKRQYAKDNNIQLLEIAYWDFENIEEILSRELGLVA